jgi:hypothetical protein
MGTWGNTSLYKEDTVISVSGGRQERDRNIKGVLTLLC